MENDEIYGNTRHAILIQVRMSFMFIYLLF